MPEGDTVYLAARRLDDALGGSRIESSQFLMPSLATADVSGRIVREVVPYGKHLLFRFDDDRTLHTHFRMDGTWHLYAPGQRWRGGPTHQVRVVLRTISSVAVGFRVHDVALLPTADEHRLVGHLGPDILADNWSATEVINRISRRPEVSIATALVDQRNVAGIGNIYRTEALFLSGVDPRTPVADLTPQTLGGCVDSARNLMMRNRGRASQSTTGDEQRAHYVYGRSGRSCRRCGTRIERTRLGELNRDAGLANEQWVAWCPTCQPGPRPPD